jgi:NAD+ kinase
LITFELDIQHMNVLLFFQNIKQEDYTIVNYLVDYLEKSAFRIFALEKNEYLKSFEYVETIDKNAIQFKHIDFVMTLGGDGTMLKAAHMVSALEIPIIGINLGRLGFLSSIEKTKINDSINKIKKRAFTIEKRSMLSLTSNLPLFDDYPHALNDFTIHKRDTSSMITLHTYIDGKFLNTYWADGVIIATPTGSTGYSLACGGPIVFPESKNFVITPIAPHNLNVRPLIINDDVSISFEIEGRAENFLCTMDSRYETITDEFKLSVSKSKIFTNLIILDNTNFSQTIREKLLWGLDKRN